MSQKFYTLITQQGAALLANATALGIPLKLCKMAVGDANGSATTPDASQTKLIHEVYKAPLNSLTTDEKNPNQIIAELVIPENQGGWFINEIGLYDEDDTLVAVGNCPTTYKPKLSEGSGRTQVVRMIFMIGNGNDFSLKIDPSVVLATRQYVEELITSKIEVLEQFVKDKITPVGVPMPWPQIHPPTGYFECNGAEFDKNQFQKLATAYPSGKLPDLRGEFIRGWDNARGVDPNRMILDWQQDAIRDIWGRLSVVGRSAGQGPIEAEGVFSSDSRWSAAVRTGSADDWGRVYSFNASRVVPVANENRPRNVAFMYIVKAE